MFNKILRSKITGFSGFFLFIAAIFVILLVQRAFPYFLYGPFGFGYDTGIYKKTFEGILSVSDIFTSQVSILPSFLAYLVDFFHLPMELYLYFFYIFASAFIVIPLYLLTREYFGKEAGVVAAVLFTVSAIQVIASQFFLFKAMIGASFLLFSLYFYGKKSYLFYIFALLLAFTQLPQLLLLIVAVSFDALIDFKNKKLFYFVGIFALLGLLSGLYIYNFDQLSNAINVVFSSLTGQGVGSFDSHQTGLFMTVTEYFGYALYIFLFGIFGIFLSYKKEGVLPLQTGVIFVMVVIFWHLFFQNRFVVEMDLLLMPFAAHFLVTVFKKYLKKLVFRRSAAAFLMAGVLVTTFLYYKTTLPALSDYEVYALEFINEQKESNYVFVTDTRYAPWFYGFSNKITMAPGIFESVWDFDTWTVYHAGDVEKKVLMLTALTEKYGTFYLFEGLNQADLNYQDKSSQIKRLFAVSNAKVYQILPQGNL
ncbi:ABC transporter ATP-binding protein [Candidatus Peregrinibacteria bacterium]|nr:ABC transporter ATP-binding protein [Candidatus Peregrinibacteria bacterium]